MNDIEEKGYRKNKIKYVSKLVAISLISISTILGIILHIYLFYTAIYFHYYGVSYIWDVYFLFYGAPILIITFIIFANCISLPGFIALGIYSYFLYLRFEYYLFLRSETKFEPKLRFRAFHIALLEVVIFCAWCLFSSFLFNYLILGLLIITFGVLIMMTIVAGMYYLLESLK